MGSPNTFEELRMDRVWDSLLQEVRPKARPAPEASSPQARSPRGHLESGALRRRASPQGKIRRPADPGVQARVLRPANPRQAAQPHTRRALSGVPKTGKRGFA